MANSIQRLTIFALISALELDLRDVILLHIAPLVDESKLLPQALRVKAVERLQKESPTPFPKIEDLIPFVDLGDEIQIIRSHDARLDETSRLYFKKYYLGMESLIPVRNRVMHSRPLEFDDLIKVSNVSYELVRSQGSLWANLRTARKLLDKDPDYFSTLTIPKLADETTNVLHNLPQSEFEDTGFIGRERELSELKRALSGSYPVVTVVGEGGLGKTALALKACYDLLDDPEIKLDAIVWTTAKTTRLTPTEIQIIDGAISSSLGIIENAAGLLGRQKDTSAIEDLILHLKNNKILLVIDNLETVIDQTVGEIVKNLPSGSRILFTTRIGLGAFDFPIQLSPFSKKESSVYFRRTAQAWGVKDLAGATPAVVEGYCEKLQNNPLFIKWFIQSVGSGRRPTALTGDLKILLQFCLQNVFNALSPDARAIAGILASVSGSQTVAMLAFFSDMDSIAIQGALSRLISSNLISVERGRTSEDEDRYLVSPLARMYIQQYMRPDVASQKRLLSKQNALRSAQEEYSSKVGSDTFDINNIAVRDKDDFIVAKMLSSAMDQLFRDDVEAAKSLVERAHDLSPNYFEVHRVRAMCSVAEEDIFGAEASYQAALSLAPERAPLRVWYAGFLSRQVSDQEGAIKQLTAAEDLAKEVPFIDMEFARILQYQRNFDEAKNRLDGVKSLDSLPARMRRVHLDLNIQNELRRAEFLIGKEDFHGALAAFEAAKEIFSAANPRLIDERTLRNVARASRNLSGLARAFRGLPEDERVNSVAEWIENPRAQVTDGAASLEDSIGFDQRPDGGGESELAVPNRGRLVALHQNYGFIVSSASRLFFHRGNWLGTTDYLQLGEGTVVEFEPTVTSSGPAALRVRPIGGEQVKEKGDIILYGKIKKINERFGFIAVQGNQDYFLHKTNCKSGTRYADLFVGQGVRFKVGVAPDGRAIAKDCEAFSGIPPH